MSGKGNCYDNAAVETFFKSLSAEVMWRNRFDTRRQTRQRKPGILTKMTNTKRNQPSHKF